VICAPSAVWGFPYYRPALFGISTFQPLDGKRTLFNASTTIENQTYGAGVTKKKHFIDIFNFIHNCYNAIHYLFNHSLSDDETEKKHDVYLSLTKL